MDKRNSWYIDNKGKTILYLGEVEYTSISKIPESILTNLTDDKRHLYLDKKILLKYFSEDELDKGNIKEILDVLFEDCGENFLYSSKKPRKTVNFLGERTSKISEGFVYKAETGLYHHVYKFI